MNFFSYNLLNTIMNGVTSPHNSIAKEGTNFNKNLSDYL